jgi:hypothetical protein
MSIITDRDEIMNIRERIFKIADKITKKEGFEKINYYGTEYKVLKEGVGDINNNTYIYYILLNGTQLCYSYAMNNPNSPYFNNLLQTPLPLIMYKVNDINLRYIDLLNTLYTNS